MAGERSVRISFEAREELSRAVQKIDAALGQLKGSLGSTSAAFEGSDLAAGGFSEELDDVANEAQEATVSMGALMGASAGLQAAFAGLDDVDIDDRFIPKDAISDGAIGLDALTDSLVGFTEVGDIPDDHPFRQISKQKGMPLTDVVNEFKQAEARLASDEEGFTGGRMEVPVELEEGASEDLREDVNQASEIAESTAQTVEIGANADLDDVAGELLKIRAMVETFEQGMDVDVGIDIEASDEVVELAALIAGMEATQAAAMQTALSTRTAASGIDKMGDEATESAAEMGALASVASLMSLNTTALSINVGAFNIALSQLMTQVPILIALLGTLATVIMGVAGAAGLAAAGFAGIVAGGFIAELERVESQFDNIESKAEAMQAIMQSLTDAFFEAFQPLIEAGGEANAFFNVINGLLETVNLFSKAIADSMQFSGQQMREFIEVGEGLGLIDDSMSDSEVDEQIMSLGEFFDEMGQIWQENVDDIVKATQIMSAFLLPVLADMIEFFVAGFDDMILFVTRFTNELAKLAPVFQELLDFAVQLIDIGSTVLQGLLPVLVGVLAVGTQIASMLNNVEPQIIKNIAAIAALAVVTSRVIGIYKNLAAAIQTVIAGTMLETLWTGIAANAKAAYAGEITAATAAQRVSNLVTSMSIGLLKTQARRLYSLVPAFGAASAATYAYAAAAWAAAIPTMILAAPLYVIIGALGALVAVGALAVGVLANMDSVTAGLHETLKLLKAGIMGIVSVFVGSFIDVFNSMKMMFEAVMMPIRAVLNGLDGLAAAFGMTGSSGGMLSSIVAALKTGLELLLLPIEILFAAVGGLAKILGTILAGSINVMFQVINGAIGAVMGLFNAFLNLIGIGGSVGGFFSSIMDGIKGLIDAILSLPDTIRGIADSISLLIQGMMNFVIDIINDLIQKIPKGIRDRIGLGTIDRVDIVNEQDDMTREDVTGGDGEDAKSAQDDMAATRANEFNFSEENVNNVSQDINADPEDEEGLRRVVKDAMEEANAFNRRTQGHGG